MQRLSDVEGLRARARQPLTISRRSARRSRGQPPNQFIVGRWKVEFGQLVARHPAHLLPEQRHGIVEKRARVEMQLDSPLGVLVRDDLRVVRAVRENALAAGSSVSSMWTMDRVRIAIPGAVSMPTGRG